MVDNFHFYQWIYLTIFSCFLAYRSKGYFTKIQLTAFCYFIGYALFAAFSPLYNPVPWLTEILSRTDLKQDPANVAMSLSTVMPGAAGQTAIILLVYALFSRSIKQSLFHNIIKFICLTEAAFLLTFKQGLMSGTTFSSAAILFGLWFCDFKKKSDWLIILPIISAAIMFIGSSTVAVAVLLLLPYFLQDERKGIAVLRAAIMTILLAVVLFFVNNKFILNSSGRTDIWEQAIIACKGTFNIWFGAGTGTWEWIGPFLKNNTPTGLRFYLLHNDYLQILLDSGLIGLLLILAVCGEVLWRLRRESLIFVALAYMVLMFTYYPLHWPLTQLIGFYIIKRSNTWREESKT